MSSPKHLWSGDWDRHPSPDPPPATLESSPPADTEPDGPPRTTRRALAWSTGAGVLVIVAVVVVLIATSGGSKPRTLGTPQAQVPTLTTPNSGGGGLIPTTPQTQSPTTASQQPTLPSAVQSGPTYSWLGMQISSTGSGVTVSTVDPGGAADTAGLDPGDVISVVNGQPINSISQLTSAVSSLAIGKTFALTVDRGSTVVSVTPTLANRPKRQ